MLCKHNAVEQSTPLLAAPQNCSRVDDFEAVHEMLSSASFMALLCFAGLHLGVHNILKDVRSFDVHNNLSAHQVNNHLLQLGAHRDRIGSCAVHATRAFIFTHKDARGNVCHFEHAVDPTLKLRHRLRSGGRRAECKQLREDANGLEVSRFFVCMHAREQICRRRASHSALHDALSLCFLLYRRIFVNVAHKTLHIACSVARADDNRQTRTQLTCCEHFVEPNKRRFKAKSRVSVILFNVHQPAVHLERHSMEPPRSQSITSDSSNRAALEQHINLQGVVSEAHKILDCIERASCLAYMLCSARHGHVVCDALVRS